MTNKYKWIYWVIAIAAVIAIVYSIRSCSDKVETNTTVTTKDVKIVIPEVNGDFSKPTSTEELPSSGKDSVRIYEKLIYVESKVNEDLKKELATSQDKYAVLLSAVRERDYVNTFSDKYVNIQAKSKVDGRLQDIKLSYTINARDTVVQEKTITKETIITKTDKFGILAGGQFKQNIDTRKSNYEASAGVRLGKVNVLGSVNTNKEAGIGVLIEF